MTTVFVAVGPPLLSEVLAHALEHRSDLDVSHHGGVDGVEVTHAVGRSKPEIALLDYWLLNRDGPAATRAIRSSLPKTKILLFSWAHGPQHVEEALAAGAVGFLPKSLSVGQVVEAIRQAHTGRPLVYADELATLVGDIRRRGEEAKQHWDALMTLTPREREILQVLSEGGPPKELARELSITPGTLKNYMHQILAKTGAHTRTQAIDMARFEGVIHHRRPAKPPPAAS